MNNTRIISVRMPLALIDALKAYNPCVSKAIKNILGEKLGYTLQNLGQNMQNQGNFEQNTRGKAVFDADAAAHINNFGGLGDKKLKSNVGKTTRGLFGRPITNRRPNS